MRQGREATLGSLKLRGSIAVVVAAIWVALRLAGVL